MIRRVILAAVAAASLAAPAAAFAQDWGYGRRDGYDRRYERREREHERRERREWREHQRYRRAYPSYGYYAPRYRPQRCWQETRPVGRYSYEVVTRCR